MIGVSSGGSSAIGQGWRGGERKRDPSFSPGIEQHNLREPWRHAKKGKTFDGEDGLYTSIDPSSSKAISDDPTLEPKYKIFLSHSGAQKDFVDHLCKALEERCPYPFFDGRFESLPKGENFPSLILKTIQQCELFVVVLSEEYFMSKWCMVELNAFVEAKKERQSNINLGILPLFYGLSVSELKDDKKRQRWFQNWETFARDDPKGLIKVDDWKYALDELTKFNGLPYVRGSNQVVEYGNEIVSQICTLVPPEICKTFDGEDSLSTSIDLSSSEAISNDRVLEPKYKIFLSHSGAQKNFVGHLCEALEERCPYPFFDGHRESLSKDENFPDLILKTVQQCELFVVVLSEEYFMSKWPMVELNAFVEAKKERQSNINLGILPLFYGLSVSELKDDKKRQRWFQNWETFARDDPKGLIKVDDWKYALDELTKFNGLPYVRGSNQVVDYKNEIVSQICKLVNPDSNWEDSHAQGNAHEVVIEKMKKHMVTEISPLSLLKEAMIEFARLSDSTILTFPLGNQDPVRIEDKDLQSLQPKKHLSIKIINFYIKYLEKDVLSIKDKDRFFFFNCSFFISTFGTKTTSTDIDYEQARQWTRGVNLFEKDYIFIPVLKSGHWSLIIIYHLNNLTKSPSDVHYRSPCIFHLYSVEGKHDDLEGDIRSFIFKSWTEIHQNSDILQALFRMKYVEAKVPQEAIGYDSGVYLLYYVELFILESASPDFSFGTNEGKSHFPHWDTSEAVAKRKLIQNLILKLSGMTQLQGMLRLHSSEIFSWLQFKATSEGHIEDVQNNDLTMVNGEDVESKHGSHPTRGMTMLNERQPFEVKETLTLLGEETKLPQILPRLEDTRRLRHSEESLLQPDNNAPILHKKSENRRSRKLNWSASETSVLLFCIVGFDRFPQGNNATRWDFIVGEVNKACGTAHTKMQCQYRFDTLSKAFKQVDEFCMANAKEFSEITEKERREMKLATTLTREWYTLMAQHYAYKAKHKECGKRPFDCATSSSMEIQIEALADCPSSPQIDIDNLLSNSPSEFHSEILPERLLVSPNSCYDGTLAPESLLTTYPPRPLVQRRKSKSNEDEMKGIYRRAIKDVDGGLLRFKYEPRFKPPRDLNPLGGFVTYNMLSLGSYLTPEEAKDVRQIAAYYYGRNDAWLDLGDGTHFRIPDNDLVKSQSLHGNDKRIWVQHKVKEVFAAFQMEKARLNLLRNEEPLSLANLNSEMQKEAVHSHMKQGSGEVGSLSLLTTLDLRENSNLVTLPKEVGNWTSLTTLKLESYSSLVALPKEVGNLSSLTTLYLKECLSLVTLPKEVGNLSSLTTLTLKQCSSLVTLPKEVGNLSSLTSLNLWGCSRLVAVPRELGNLSSLTSLNLWGCSSLVAMPRELGNLSSLTILNLNFCSSLVTLPKEVRNMSSLTTLTLKQCSSLATLPKEVGNLSSLTTLKLESCSSLVALPKEVGNLSSLTSLNLWGCSSLVALPKEAGNLSLLTSLHLSFCSRLAALPKEVGNLSSLTTFNLDGCSRLAALPIEVGNLSSFTTLNLDGCSSLVALPKEVGKLSSLTTLNLRSCLILIALPKEVGNLSSLTTLHLSGCSSLVSLPKEVGNLSSLTTLDLWQCSSLVSLPKEVGNLSSLTTLNLDDCSSLVALPKEVGNLSLLATMNLRRCSSLASLPKEVGNLSSLTSLNLSFYSNLIALPKEVGNLSSLTTLKLEDCSSLATLPKEVGNLSSLTTLNLDGCSSLVALPKEVGNLSSLTTLNLDGCLSLVTLPKEVGNLSLLATMNLRRCSSLASLPKEVGNLSSLTTLDLNRCSSLAALPKEVGNLSSLTTLDLNRCSSLAALPKEVGNLSSLTILHLSGCSSLVSLPKEVGNLSSLTTLDLWQYSSLVSLPKEVGNLSSLTTLDLEGCSSLAALPKEVGNLSSLTTLDLDGCSSLAALPKEVGNLSSLTTLDLMGCSSLAALPKEVGNLSSLTTLDLMGCLSLAALPKEVGNLSSLTTLDLKGCSSLAALPKEVGNLSSLITLCLGGFSSMVDLPSEVWNFSSLTFLSFRDYSNLVALPQEMGNLSSLTTLDLTNCSSLVALPKEIRNLSSLTTIKLRDCSSLVALPKEVGNLSSLTTLDLEGCSSLAALPKEVENLPIFGTPKFKG